MNRYFWRDLIGEDLTFFHAAWLTVLASLGLSLLGVYAIDVGTAPLGPEAAGAAEGGGGGLVARQLVFLTVGIVGAAVVATPHYRYIRYAAWPAMLGVLALLVVLLVPVLPAALVRPVNGARAWIHLPGFDLQPSELGKIAFILVLASYLRFRKNHRTLLGLLPPAVICFVPVALILLQPDFGTASLFIPTLFCMLLAAGAKIKHLTAAVLLAMCAGPAMYPLLKPYQRERIIGMVQVMRGDKGGADDTTYQSFTAQTLAGAGGVAGLGDEKSRALVRFNRLPERHNDMVFAVVLNRFGLLGGLATLGLYGAWLLGALVTAAASKDPFGRLVVVGCAAVVATQAMINIMMNIGLAPIVGLTLPYVSYGGSSLLTVWIMTGLIVNIATRPPPRLARPSFEFRGEFGE